MIVRFDAGQALLDLFRDIRDWSTERVEKIADLLVGDTLVRVRIEATKNTYFGRAGISCKLTQINGVAISEEEQEEKVSRIDLKDELPTREDQAQVLQEALANFNLRGRPIEVTEDFVRGKLRVLELSTRIRDSRKGEVRQ